MDLPRGRTVWITFECTTSGSMRFSSLKELCRWESPPLRSNNPRPINTRAMVPGVSTIKTERLSVPSACDDSGRPRTSDATCELTPARNHSGATFATGDSLSSTVCFAIERSTSQSTRQCTLAVAMRKFLPINRQQSHREANSNRQLRLAIQ